MRDVLDASRPGSGIVEAAEDAGVSEAELGRQLARYLDSPKEALPDAAAPFVIPGTRPAPGAAACHRHWKW